MYAEAPNRVGETEGQVDRFVSQLGGGGAGVGDPTDGAPKEHLTEEEKAEFRRRSLEHYLACGAAFAGLLAEACGENGDELTRVANEGASAPSGVAAAASAGAASAAASAGRHSATMAALRERVSSLRPPASAKEDFDDLREMLDEIQEAMDTAEETEEGLRSLGEMKANEMKKHDAKRNGGAVGTEGGDGGATTTIGFGSASGAGGFGAASGVGTANAFGGAATATAAPTMMVVKKKKKKPQGDGPSKRLKPSQSVS